MWCEVAFLSHDWQLSKSQELWLKGQEATSKMNIGIVFFVCLFDLEISTLLIITTLILLDVFSAGFHDQFLTEGNFMALNAF